MSVRAAEVDLHVTVTLVALLPKPCTLHPNPEESGGSDMRRRALARGSNGKTRRG